VLHPFDDVEDQTRTAGENFMSTGFTVEGYPSAGAWVSYALGSESENLPAFVAIPDPRGTPQSGVANWSNGFLPAVFQGPHSMLATDREFVASRGHHADGEQASREFLKVLNQKHLERDGSDTELAARIASYELAARLQLSAPE